MNYHHLYCFWRIAREGGLARDAEQLQVTHSTLSSQLRSLFERRGRRLVLTQHGEETATYADDIFRLGAELVDVARGKRKERRLALRIGVVSSMPKSGPSSSRTRTVWTRAAHAKSHRRRRDPRCRHLGAPHQMGSQTFSSLMCWAAADRAGRIAAEQEPELQEELVTAARITWEEILTKGWSPEQSSLVGAYDSTDLDAALLQAAPLRLMRPDDPMLGSTIDAIVRDLDRDGWLLRCRMDDGFGTPQVAFVLV